MRLLIALWLTVSPVVAWKFIGWADERYGWNVTSDGLEHAGFAFIAWVCHLFGVLVAYGLYALWTWAL